jgi:hypothetical protein
MHLSTHSYVVSIRARTHCLFAHALSALVMILQTAEQGSSLCEGYRKATARWLPGAAAIRYMLAEPYTTLHNTACVYCSGYARATFHEVLCRVSTVQESASKQTFAVSMLHSSNSASSLAYCQLKIRLRYQL